MKVKAFWRNTQDDLPKLTVNNPVLSSIVAAHRTTGRLLVSTETIISKVGDVLTVLDGCWLWKNASQPRHIGRIEKVAAALNEAMAENAGR